MNAIYNGQDEVAKGLDIRVPVLVCTSDRSMLQTRWDPLMARADTVLDVQSVRQAAVNLGPFVTLVTIPGALHDISMSAPDARREYFRIGLEWAGLLAWGSYRVSSRAEKAALDAVCAADGNEGWATSDSETSEAANPNQPSDNDDENNAGDSDTLNHSDDVTQGIGVKSESDTSNYNNHKSIENSSQTQDNT